MLFVASESDLLLRKLDRATLDPPAEPVQKLLLLPFDNEGITSNAQQTSLFV
jgi:hypothetical protein